jgi:putative redox protein
MATTRHIAHASGSTSADAPEWRVELTSGAYRLVADEPVAGGGGGAGPSPFDLVMSGLAACTVMTLRMYAERKGWAVAGIDVDVRYDVVDGGDPSIVRTITLPADLPQEHRDRLADIAERTPVTNAVRFGTPIATSMRAGAA